MVSLASSPASSGPAGSLFEGQVGAYYLLSILTGTDPRGLPGTTIDRVEFQRAAEGRSLDDVIVHARDINGNPAVLEIQVKRNITFSPRDQVFHKVVNQIAETSRRTDFWTTRYELAIATAKTSQKIERAYQEVLTWARQIGDAATFMAQIARPGSANQDMRTFVHTFTSHLQDAGVIADDEMVWKLLRKLQIHIYDFTAQGSVAEELMKERAVRALHPDQKIQAGDLWDALISLALAIAANAGDRDRSELIEDLKGKSFRFEGERRFFSARTTLAEASRAALADIGDRVGDVILTRHERVAAVNAALDGSRYVEIRGDAGVGKSGILKRFAEQIATETQVLVLCPGRTTPRGWTAMRAVLGFDGTVRDLLSDLASDGGAVLFVDNLDFFDDQERRTVIDIVREAANVPGFSVIATARSNFGAEEPNWLPLDTLDRLGRANPIVIGELSEVELDEMRHAAPTLTPLLADKHPARNVTRNLFRLARLANRTESKTVPRTEVDMAEQWWESADGDRDDGHRDRYRLLKVLAEQSLASTEPLDVSQHPAGAIESLISSETLRDLRNDCVGFRHDVLREWAIANLIHSDSSIIDRLPLDRPAPVSLARGVELASRMALERAGESTQWESIVARLSREGAHGSWRRVALLALVRSEIGSELLVRTSNQLLANRANILCELIRIVRAVEVVPASTLFAAIGVDTAAIPENFNVPSNPSWRRLISWVLSLGQKLPAAAIPDVVDFYTEWSGGMFGQDPLTPLLMECFYRWLTEIETGNDANLRDLSLPFGGELGYDRVRGLETDLRNGFLLFCNRTPTLAVEYLRSLGQRRHNDNTIRSILEFSGNLAQAAPAEFSALIGTVMIQSGTLPHGRKAREPFGHLEYLFVPASPAKGPFFGLLKHAAHHGLPLIRRLVDHAILFYSRGANCDSDSINISFPDGDRPFPWVRSYNWSRDNGASPSVATSALMALEAWAHNRIEEGEDFEKVLRDVLGPQGAPAAYLLVAVDLLISHWPKSQDFAIPLVTCPELLSIDRDRTIYDQIPTPDFFGVNALQKEQLHVPRLKDLKERISRSRMLDELLGEYALFGSADQQETLTNRLQRATMRLGPPSKQSTLSDPALMASHALNLCNLDNWRKRSVPLTNGKQGTAYEYVSPELESQHFDPLQKASQELDEYNNMQETITLALEDPSRSSSELAEKAVKWAQNAIVAPKDESDDGNWMRKNTIVTAAMMVMRDSNDEIRARHDAWARNIFLQVLQAEDSSAHRIHSGIRHNPLAIVFAGLTYSLRNQPCKEDLRVLLELAANDGSPAAHGFGVVSSTLSSIDERLPRAVLRCALAACLQPRHTWGLPEEETTARSERYAHKIREVVDAELIWFFDDGPEPNWPVFPSEAPSTRKHLRISGKEVQQGTPSQKCSRQDEYANHQLAAHWLSKTKDLFDVVAKPWLIDIVRTYSSWTATANGLSLEGSEQVDLKPSEWNNIYFTLLAHSLPGLTATEINELALGPITSLPDESFFDIMTPFLQSVDTIYFNDGCIEENVAISVRDALANKMMKSRGWQHLGGKRSTSIEMHIGPAIATLFFNEYWFGQAPKCYLLQLGIDRLELFLPTLEKLVESGPSFFVATVTLNLIEVSPRTTHLPFIVAAAKTWLKSYPDNTDLWINQGIGRRVCVWIEKVWQEEKTILDNDQMVRGDVDRLLAALVSVGVADAGRLEELLSCKPGGGT